MCSLMAVAAACPIAATIGNTMMTSATTRPESTWVIVEHQLDVRSTSMEFVTDRH